MTTESRLRSLETSQSAFPAGLAALNSQDWKPQKESGPPESFTPQKGVNTLCHLGCFPPSAHPALSYFLYVDETPESAYRQTALEFVIAGLDLAFTFCHLATCTDDLVRADRNINNAKQALQVALTVEKRAAFRRRDQQIIDEKIFRVESLLAELARSGGGRVLSVP